MVSFQAMVDFLGTLNTNYRILLALIPPHPSRIGEEGRAAIERAELPVFKSGIRRLAVFQRVTRTAKELSQYPLILSVPKVLICAFSRQMRVCEGRSPHTTEQLGQM